MATSTAKDSNRRGDWRLVGLVIAVVGLTVPWIWQAAKYPNRAEFNEVKAEVRKVDKETTNQLHDIRTEQRVIKSDIQHIRESQKRIEDGLDRLLPRRYRAGHSSVSGAESR